ncbi:Rrf2 family transcriptional regulator, nitric oxide-sensitive transcriptional repressor [Acidocella aminolytica 101 = DSM 11237]|jgi:Rrf2 family nitric oxide-sensitive transcriptional repressor|uniref:Uncharacterized protein n=1 Tax=Acidocella aminolytica 101 = DSM 11237 TaxID=1120923 RepID=A0A0D6PIC6_9PROT|nr:hypothetical protein [Acidocella aminolytica]GAN81111.1 hypothetical protein Aam_076_016 [Acidocella aminolytica 101 = DSM 11237]SHF48423.1 Rrf2 family transcriptional regulator, nitric oxide-sensitive transcriptional repressor [Acidocella aminolytica 101 = DSM 11237]
MFNLLARYTEGKVDLVGCSECILAPSCRVTCAFREAVEKFFLILDRYNLAGVMVQGEPAQLRRILTAETLLR